jgi:hypothetical protein
MLLSRFVRMGFFFPIAFRWPGPRGFACLQNLNGSKPLSQGCANSAFDLNIDILVRYFDISKLCVGCKLQIENWRIIVHWLSRQFFH